MIQRALEQIPKEDIESLVNAKVSEKRTLDYKQHWLDNSSESKREFLYDVSSFANALGGDLVFGIEDERDAAGKATGLPASACGVAISNASSEIAQCENLIRDGISPRIQGIGWKVVKGFQVGSVIVMRVPKSLLGRTWWYLEGWQDSTRGIARGNIRWRLERFALLLLSPRR